MADYNINAATRRVVLSGSAGAVLILRLQCWFKPILLFT